MRKSVSPVADIGVLRCLSNWTNNFVLWPRSPSIDGRMSESILGCHSVSASVVLLSGPADVPSDLATFKPRVEVRTRDDAAASEAGEWQAGRCLVAPAFNSAHSNV